MRKRRTRVFWRRRSHRDGASEDEEAEEQRKKRNCAHSDPDSKGGLHRQKWRPETQGRSGRLRDATADGVTDAGRLARQWGKTGRKTMFQ